MRINVGSYAYGLVLIERRKEKKALELSYSVEIRATFYHRISISWQKIKLLWNALALELLCFSFNVVTDSKSKWSVHTQVLKVRTRWSMSQLQSSIICCKCQEIEFLSCRYPEIFVILKLDHNYNFVLSSSSVHLW